MLGQAGVVSRSPAARVPYIFTVDLSHRVRTYLFDRNALIRGRR